MKKKTSIIRVTLLFLFSIAYIARAADSTIFLDFSTGTWNGQTYEQDGFIVSPVTGTEINLQDGWIWTTAGEIKITRIDGAFFDLLSFDASAGSTDGNVGMGISLSNGQGFGSHGGGLATTTPTAPTDTFYVTTFPEPYNQYFNNLEWVILSGGADPGFISWDNIKVKITNQSNSEQESDILDFLPAILAGVINTDNDGDFYSENQGDCNDTDISIYPGAAEICGDEIDQDCDGHANNGCLPQCEVDSDCPWWGIHFICDQPDLCHGSAISGSGCLNNFCGDGVAGWPDDSACGTDIIFDCGLYADVTCNGTPQQQAPVCASSCYTDTDCKSYAYCTSNGGECLNKKVLGAFCNQNNECLSGYCSSGACSLSP